MLYDILMCCITMLQTITELDACVLHQKLYLNPQLVQWTPFSPYAVALNYVSCK